MKPVLFFAVAISVGIKASERLESSVTLPDPLPTVRLEQLENARRSRGMTFINMGHAVTIGAAHKRIGGIKKLDEIIENRIEKVQHLVKKRQTLLGYSGSCTRSHQNHFKQEFLYQRVLSIVSYEMQIIKRLFAAKDDAPTTVVLSQQQCDDAHDVLSDLYNRWYQTANTIEYDFLQMLYAFTQDHNFIEEKSVQLLQKLFKSWARKAVVSYKIHADHNCCNCTII